MISRIQSLATAAALLAGAVVAMALNMHELVSDMLMVAFPFFLSAAIDSRTKWLRIAKRTAGVLLMLLCYAALIGGDRDRLFLAALFLSGGILAFDDVACWLTFQPVPQNPLFVERVERIAETKSSRAITTRMRLGVVGMAACILMIPLCLFSFVLGKDPVRQLIFLAVSLKILARLIETLRVNRTAAESVQLRRASQ